VSDRFLIQNGLKQGDTSLPSLFISALEFTVRRVQQNQEELKLNGTHHLLAYADDFNIVLMLVRRLVWKSIQRKLSIC
jgi:hypothetical protein